MIIRQEGGQFFKVEADRNGLPITKHIPGDDINLSNVVDLVESAGDEPHLGLLNPLMAELAGGGTYI